MACITNLGIAKGCNTSIGGIKKVVIYEMTGLDTTGATISDGEVTVLAITSGFSGYSYDFLKDNSFAGEAIVGDGITAKASFTPAVNLVFRKNSAALRTEISELSKSELVALVLDQNDEWFIYGIDRGLNLVASTGSQTGSLLTDLNGITILLQGSEPQLAYTVDSSVDALSGF